MSKSLMVLLLAIIFCACSSNEETTLIEEAIENEDANVAIEPVIIDMDDERYLLAEHFSEDNEIKLDIVELVDGGYSIGLFFKPDIDKERIAVYNKLMSEAREGKITLDEMYSKLEGPTANKESINKLKTFQKKLKNVVSEAKEYNKTNEVSLKNTAGKLDCDFPQPCGGTPEPLRSYNRDFFINYYGNINSSYNSDWRSQTTHFPSIASAIYGGTGKKSEIRMGRYYRVVVYSSYATKAESHVEVYINENQGTFGGYGISRWRVPPFTMGVRDYVRPNFATFSSDVNMCPYTCFITYHAAFVAW